MNFKEALVNLRKSREYKIFKEKNKEAYLTAGFIVIEKGKQEPWQIDFYDQKKDNITSFNLKEKIEEKTDKVFRKGDEKVDKLKEQDVKITLKEALKKVDELKEREYKEGKCEKTIAIIQSINKKTLWNITEITNNFNILNIKITAKDGKVIHHACEPVFKFKTPEKKK